LDDIAPPPSAAPAIVRRSRRVSAMWLIPLLAVAIGGWLAWNTLSKQGPTITISFETAEGLQAGQSQLKFKEIVLGTVKSLELTSDHRRVLVKVGTTRQAESLLTNKTIFWVVKPRLFAGNVEGLSTSPPDRISACFPPTPTASCSASSSGGRNRQSWTPMFQDTRLS